jgi:hypothetical protein
LIFRELDIVKRPIGCDIPQNCIVARSMTEMLLEFEFCTYKTPAKESAVKLPAEPKALIAGNKE